MKKKQNKILLSIIIILILVVIGVIAFIIFKNIKESEEQQNYNNLSSSYASDIQESSQESNSNANKIEPPEDIDTNSVANPINFSDLKNINSDIYSWIYIPNTNINYPVCQSQVDDNYYLDHDVYFNSSYSGAIYSQYCNSRDYSDRVTVLYGHNMANGSMFANLHKFADADFFNNNKYFYIYTEDRKLTYEIVSAFAYDDRHIMNSFDFEDNSVFRDYLDMIVNPHSLTKNVRSGITLDTDDKILVLSTCLNSGEGRYLVQGVLVKNESTK